MIAMLSLCSSFTVLSYILSYKFADSLFSRRQYTRCVFQQLEAGVTPEALRLAPAKHDANESLVRLAGLERPPRFPWQRSGVAPAHSGVLPLSKINGGVKRNLNAP